MNFRPAPSPAKVCFVATAALLCITLWYTQIVNRLAKTVVANSSCEKVEVQDLDKEKQSVDSTKKNKGSSPLHVISGEEIQDVNISCNFTRTKTDPPYKICIRSLKNDIAMSHDVVVLGAWEGHLLYNFKRLLQQYPNMILLDVGTNIGTYSLLAAAMGHNVISVEPSEDNLKLLKQSIFLNKFQDRMTIIQNAISDKPENLSEFIKRRDNPGGLRMVEYNGKDPLITAVTLADLCDLFPRNVTLLMKIDIEGHEEKAMSQAEPMFQCSFVPFIMMEWSFQKGNVKLVNMMESYNYYPVSHRNGRRVHMDVHITPTDIIWVHQSAQLPDDIHYVKKHYKKP